MAKEIKGVSTYSGEIKGERLRQEPLEYNVLFTQNRTFELHVGGTIYIFPPHGVKRLPASVVEHPDFRQVAAYFAVTEV